MRPAQARVEPRGEQEGDLQLGQAAARSRSARDRSRRPGAQNVGAARAPGGRAVAVLDDRHAARRHDDRRRRRDVDRARAIAAGSARIEREKPGADPAFPADHAFADRGDGPFELVGGLAFDLEGPSGMRPRRRRTPRRRAASAKAARLSERRGPCRRRASRGPRSGGPSRHPDCVLFHHALDQPVETDDRLDVIGPLIQDLDGLLGDWIDLVVDRRDHVGRLHEPGERAVGVDVQDQGAAPAFGELESLGELRRSRWPARGPGRSSTPRSADWAGGSSPMDRSRPRGGAANLSEAFDRDRPRSPGA